MTNNARETCAVSIRKILEATRFAAEKHAGQRRKGHAGEPYINHLVEVSDLIANSSETVDVNLIIAGLLHDLIEDTDVTAQEIEKRFGKDVAGLVLEATDDKSLPKEARKALQVETAPHKSQRAQVLKLADKISNVRSLISSPPAEWSRERKLQYGEWAWRVVAGFTSPNPFLLEEFKKAYADLIRSHSINPE